MKILITLKYRIQVVLNEILTRVKLILFNKNYFLKVNNLNKTEFSKSPTRTEVINYLLSIKNYETNYLEIGVRDPSSNFNKIKSKIKLSVDPGIEYELNPVDFKMTSDCFFEGLRNNEYDIKVSKFDVIFIDGLHLADQVERDILNSLDFIRDDGFIVIHDCNPPSEFHAREDYLFKDSPALEYWNGTTWKAFYKFRQNPQIYSCCIDSDWGIGIISKIYNIGRDIENSNYFFEYEVLSKNRTKHLNLMSYEHFKNILENLIGPRQ
jgi:hypothetical protein